MDINYAIMNTTDLNLVDFDLLLQTSVESLRYNLNGDKFIIKWIGETPTFLPEGTIIYNQSQMLIIGISDEWYQEINPIIEE